MNTHVAKERRQGGPHFLPASVAAGAGRADHDLTVIIPAYNEEKRLPWTLCQIGMFLDQWGIDYRVVVADDCSSDRTPQLAKPLGPRFSTVSLPQHGGKGCAVRTAMLRATGRVVAFTDADLPFELGALREGYEWLHQQTCEVVFGARDIEGARHIAARRLSRRLATFGFREIVKRLVSREVTDTQCGLKLFTHRAAREIFSRATIDGFAFDAEVVYLARRLRLPFRRLPVSLIHDYDSTLSLRRHALPMLWDVVWMRLREWLGGQRVAAVDLSQPEEISPREAAMAKDDPRKLAA